MWWTRKIYPKNLAFMNISADTQFTERQCLQCTNWKSFPFYFSTPCLKSTIFEFLTSSTSFSWFKVLTSRDLWVPTTWVQISSKFQSCTFISILRTDNTNRSRMSEKINCVDDITSYAGTAPRLFRQHTILAWSSDNFFRNISHLALVSVDWLGSEPCSLSKIASNCHKIHLNINYHLDTHRPKKYKENKYFNEENVSIFAEDPPSFRSNERDKLALIFWSVKPRLTILETWEYNETIEHLFILLLVFYEHNFIQEHG